MTRARIPFTRLTLTGRELEYVRAALESGELAGDGPFAKRCEKWLEETTGCSRALLTHSCTGALEMAAILAGVGRGDEVIMPSFTFTSTANAFVLRGAVPVFVDVERETMNIDPRRVAAAITPRTRAVVPVHYAGVACDMDAIAAIACDAGLMIIEDAAQALLSTYRDRPLGSIGAMAALSFHQTKNITAGEAGALLINDGQLIARAEIVREKGTNRSEFHRGEVDKYTWIDVGSSYLPSELTAAFLFAQLEGSRRITERRVAVWELYHAALAPLEQAGLLARQCSRGNGHIYFVILRSLQERTYVSESLRAAGISAVFHYVPLHNSPAGIRYGRFSGPMTITEDVSERLLRLPITADMTSEEVDAVVAALSAALHTDRR